jgi:ribosome-associated translation inhibitor RaiA
MRVDGALSKAGVAGDPDMVSAAATRFGQTAELIASAAEGLHQLDAEAAQSDAIAAFLAKAGEIEAQLRRVHERYVGAADALRTYSEALRRAQEQAGPAVREHEAATADRDAATTLAGRYEGMALLATSEEAQLDYQELARVQRLREEEARGRVVKHGRQVDEAVTDLEAAATAAIARFDDLSADGLGDSWWDDVRGAAGTAYDAFRTWMEENDAWIDVIATWTDRLGMALGLAAMVFPALAPFAAAALVFSFALTALRAAAGTATLLDLGLSALSLATMGTGAALVKGAGSAVKGVQAARAAELVRTGVPPRLATAWVSASFSRGAPGIGDKMLARSLGDVDAAQIRSFLRSGRPGSAADDVETVTRIVRQLDTARLLNGLGQVKAVVEEIVEPTRAPWAVTRS